MCDLYDYEEVIGKNKTLIGYKVFDIPNKWCKPLAYLFAILKTPFRDVKVKIGESITAEYEAYPEQCVYFFGTKQEAKNYPWGNVIVIGEIKGRQWKNRKPDGLGLIIRTCEEFTVKKIIKKN